MIDTEDFLKSLKQIALRQRELPSGIRDLSGVSKNYIKIYKSKVK